MIKASVILLRTLVALAVGSMVIAAPLVESDSQSAAAATVTKPQFSNRVVFIRHAEKGWAPDQKPKATDLQGPFEINAGRKDRKVGRGGWGRDRPGRGGPGGPGGPGDHPDGPHGPHGPGGPGEPGGPDKFPSGLSDKGRERAQWLRTLFGNESEYDFGLIFAAPRIYDEIEFERTYATVLPLAQDLGLTIDISCANEVYSCIADRIEAFSQESDKDILISWKHRDLNLIATALGAPNAKRIYPDNRNDVIWTMQDGKIVEKRSQHCPGLDDGRVDENDPDLEVEQPDQVVSTSKLPVWDTVKAALDTVL